MDEKVEGVVEKKAVDLNALANEMEGLRLTRFRLKEKIQGVDAQINAITDMVFKYKAELAKPQ